MPDDAESWPDRRSEAAAAHADALERRRAGESARASRLLAEFVATARAEGLPTERLRARSYDGRSRYRTSVDGWYLRRNESVAVGTDGEFYVLAVPAALRYRVTGAPLTPSDPPMTLGKGGRDGESIDLPDALALALTHYRGAQPA